MNSKDLLRGLPILTVESEPIDEVAARNRNIFRALAPCPLNHTQDTRSGMLCGVRRSMTVCRRWKIRLPDTQVFVHREHFK